MIQLEQNDKSKEGYYNIYVDRSLVSSSWAYRPISDTNFPFQFSARSEPSCKRLLSQTIEDFEPFSVISLNNLFSWMVKGHSIIITSEIDEESRDEYFVFTFYFSPNLTFWNEKYSFAEYFNEFESHCENLLEIDYKITFEETPALRLDFYFNKFTFPIKNIVIELEEDIKSIHLSTVENLRKKFQTDLLKAEFNFPEELKIPCEQYLLYFAQFLQDLGINATSNLKEEAGKVLFSITPTGDVEALDKIREALAVYLNLPASPIVYDESFAAMRLQQQVENLQHSQKLAVREVRLAERELLLAQLVIEQQDNLLRQKDSIIEQKNKIIDKITSLSIMMDSLENKEELEEIYDGLKIGESEFLKKQLGIHLNPAKLVKTAVKNTFGKDEKKSVLGLDEKD